MRLHPDPMLVEEVDIYLVKVVIVVITKISSDKNPTHTFFSQIRQIQKNEIESIIRRPN